MISANDYAKANNLPDYIIDWSEVEDLTGKTFADITIELADTLPPNDPKNFELDRIKPIVKPSATTPANSLEALIAAAISPFIANPANVVDEDRVMELIKQYAPIKHIEIKSNDFVRTVSAKQHEKFERVLRVLACDKHIYLYGPAGTGKTQMAENAAVALGKRFACISVCAQSTKSDLLGFIDANGNYVRSIFRDIFENGGVFLIDEIDNGNPNILAVLNSALANGYCAFPDGMIKRNSEFICIAAANTFGTGATRQYVGRNQLDAATLNRFIPIEIGYDEKLEVELFGAMAKKVQAIRKKYADSLVIISMRNICNVVDLIAGGFTEAEAIELAVTGTIPTNLLKK